MGAKKLQHRRAGIHERGPAIPRAPRVPPADVSAGRGGGLRAGTRGLPEGRVTADRCDLLVRGARVIDPAQALDAVADVAVAGGRIAGVGDMPVPRAARVIDGGGLVASPGWIDLHVHCVEGPGVGAVHPDRDAGIDAGVTTVVDTGSVGVDRLDELLDVARSARTRVLGFLNVSATRTAPVHGDWQAFDQARTIAAAERH